MIPAPTPTDEAMRIAALHELRILDTPPEDRFDRITRLALRLFDVPIAMVSLVDVERQWFKSCRGLEVHETPRDISFCGHAILADEPLVVTDAARDARFAENPLVVGDPKLRFYAGQSLRGPGGHRIGTLCVADRAPRQMSADDLQALTDLAACAESELTLSRMSPAQFELIREREGMLRRAVTDSLTGRWNRGAIVEVLERELLRARRERTPLGVVIADLDRFKEINDTFGHGMGDVVLKEAATRIHHSIRPYDAMGRYGGDEFLVVLPGCDARGTRRLAERILRQITAAKISHDGFAVDFGMSLGATAVEPCGDVSPEVVIRTADDALFAAKRAGRGRFEFTSLIHRESIRSVEGY